MGLALMPCIGADLIEGMVRVDIGEPILPLDLFVVAHAELAHLPHVRAVIDHIVEQAAVYADRLSGKSPSRG